MLRMKTLAYILLTSVLLKEILSQAIPYTGTLTKIVCPAQGNYTLPSWNGPPYTTYTGTPYTLTGSPQFNPVLPADKLFRLMYADNQRDLLLNNTRMGDAGVYTCFITGQLVATNELRVRVLSAAPEITSAVTIYNNGVRATEGQSVTVTCTSRGGNPAPTVVWYKGSITGQELAGTSTGTQVGNTYSVTLAYTFTPSRQDDRQQLVCRSYYPTPVNSQGSQQKAVTLYLYLKPLQPTLPRPVSVVSGNNVTATCTTTGSRPVAHISWTYRGQTYTPAVSITEDLSSQTSTVVSVLQRPVTAADNWQSVQCIVTHTALTNTLSESKTIDIQFPVGKSTSRLTGNTAIEADGVNQLTLTCTTGPSNPASSITWRNGSDVISNTNAYTAIIGEYNGVVRSQTLTLRPTRYDDGNTISCSVSNGVQQVTDTTSTVLSLLYSPVITDMSDMDVTEGDSVTLKCNASSKPVSSFTWKKGSTTVAQGTGTASYNGYDYTISTVNRNQAGTYTCTANNQLSQPDSKQTSLTVLSRAGYTITDAIVVKCSRSTWSIRVNMTALQNLYPTAKASDIYLGDNSCNGNDYSGEIEFHRGLDQCLTSQTMQNGAQIYRNELIYAKHDPVHPFLIRSLNWTVQVECEIDKKGTTYGRVHSIKTTATQSVNNKTYTVSMKFYEDANYMIEIRGNPLSVPLGTQVYVKVFTRTDDWGVKMIVDTCYTKPEIDAQNHLKVDIIKHGCEVDAYTHFLTQSAHETRLVFQQFAYTTSHEGIFLFCDAIFCDISDHSDRCSQTCHPGV